MVNSTILVTASSASGNLSRITLALWKQGFKTRKTSLHKDSSTGCDEIYFDLESSFAFGAEALSVIKQKVPTIVKVDLVNSSSTQTPVQTVRTQQRTQLQPTRPRSITEDVAPQRPKTSQDIVHDAGQKLIAVYPDINTLLTQLQTMYGMPPTSSQMLAIGSMVGTHAAQKHLANNSQPKMSNTVKNSLLMGQNLYGNSPVISDLLSKSKKQQEAKSPENRFDVVASELGKFMLVSTDKNTLVLENCPHIVSNRGETSECDFVTGFLNSFITGICNGQQPNIGIFATRSKGASACRIGIELPR